MALIPAGKFLMGTDEAEIERRFAHLGPRLREMLRAESPRREVRLPSFYMDTHEVTNAQFECFLNENPQWRPDRIDARTHNGDYLKHWNGGGCPRGLQNHPLVYVTWHAAMAYAVWAGKRLPTECEWEYAARGGLQAAEYPWGNDISPERANYAASGIGETTPVGRYPANGFGLYDTAGNVWEFCMDEWQQTGSNCLDAASLRQVLSNWRTVTTRRVIRGGSWGGTALNLRVAYRDSHPPGGAGPHVGFRCVKTAG